MSIVKKENWWLCLIINIFTLGLFFFVLAYAFHLYDKNAWYHNKWYWILGAICLIFPVFVMLLVFNIQMIVKTANALKVPGSQIYTLPYFWILGIIIPIIGWAILIAFYIYLLIWPNFMLKKGNGEELIKNI